MKTSIKNKTLFIEIPLNEPHPSKSGKTLIIASTHGCIQSECSVSGKPVTISINAFIPK